MKWLFGSFGIAFLILLTLMVIVGIRQGPEPVKTAQQEQQQDYPGRFRALCERLDNEKISDMTPKEIDMHATCRLLANGDECYWMSLESRDPEYFFQQALHSKISGGFERYDKAKVCKAAGLF